MNMIHARVGLQQRVLPEYRAEFFDTLATACLQGLGVFAGEPCQGEAVEVEELARRADERMADTQDRGLPERPQPEVPVIHQEVHSVRLARDGVGVHGLNLADRSHGEFTAAGRTVVASDDTGNGERRFLPHALCQVIGLWRRGLDDTLTQPGAVADEKEDDLAAGSLAVQPAAQCDFTAGMRLQVPDLSMRRHGRFVAQRNICRNGRGIPCPCGAAQKAPLLRKNKKACTPGHTGLPTPQADGS